MAPHVGVLAQSPATSDHTPARALAQTVALARLAAQSKNKSGKNLLFPRSTA